MTTIVVTLIAYMLALIAIGVVCQRRTRDGADYLLGGRRLGPIVAALSAAASSSSSWTLLGVSGAAYKWGLSAIWIFPACVGGFVLNWFVLAPSMRRYEGTGSALTVTELLAGPPGRPMRRGVIGLASAIVLASLTVYVAAQFLAAGKTFQTAFDWSFELSVLAGGAIVCAYMFLGGFWAVSITDTLQGMVMATACVVLPLAALASIGGPTAFVDAFLAIDVEGFHSLFDNAEKTGGIGFVLGLLGIGLGYPGQPHVVNRFMALREGESELRRARVVAIVWAVVVYAGMIFLGWCGRVLVERTSDPETIFIALATELLHPGVAGVMIAAVLSAIMSTADSQLLVAASAVTNDLGLGARSRIGLLARSRIVVVALVALAIVGALAGSGEIFRPVLSAWTAMGAAFGPLLVVTVFRGPVSPARSMICIATGFGLASTFYAIPATRGGFVGGVVPYLAVGAILVLPGRRASA